MSDREYDEGLSLYTDQLLQGRFAEEPTTPEEAMILKLSQLVSPAAIPPMARQRITARLNAEWDQQAKKRRTNIRKFSPLLAMAAAAALVLVGGGVLWGSLDGTGGDDLSGTTPIVSLEGLFMLGLIGALAALAYWGWLRRR